VLGFPYKVASGAYSRSAGSNNRNLCTIQYLTWQDGAAILLRGKLPFAGILVFLGKEGLAKGGIIRRPNDLQISHVLPITLAKFNAAEDYEAHRMRWARAESKRARTYASHVTYRPCLSATRRNRNIQIIEKS
jgi:hypothetical protein